MPSASMTPPTTDSTITSAGMTPSTMGNSNSIMTSASVTPSTMGNSNSPMTFTNVIPSPTICPTDSTFDIHNHNCIIVVSASAGGGVFSLLFICFCCVGMCICWRKSRRRRIRKKPRCLYKDEDTWFAEGPSTLTTPIDDATGQMNQQRTALAENHTSTVTLPAGLLAAYETSMPCKETRFDEIKMADKPNKSMEKTLLTNDTKLNKTTHNSVSDQQEITTLSCHPKPPYFPMSHHHDEHVVSKAMTETCIDVNEEPVYDDITTDSQSIKVGKIGANAINETQPSLNHDYESKVYKMEPSSPSKHNYELVSSKGIETHLSSNHDYETVLSKVETNDLPAGHDHNRPHGLVLMKERPVIRAPKQKLHNYEEIDEDISIPTRHITRETMEIEELIDPSAALSDTQLYNKLSNTVDSDQLLNGVVKAVHPCENSPVNNYYSITQVHKLVPIGGKVEPYVTDHLYQELNEGKGWQGGQASLKEEQPFNRHHTFTSSMTSMNVSRGPLVRTYSESIERLEPMYDEPYQVSTNQSHRGKAVSKVADARSFESLFDEPKYTPRDSPLFDDPKYHTTSDENPLRAIEDERRVIHATASAKVFEPPSLPPRLPFTCDGPASNPRVQITK